jgi:hypothetical protein
MNVLVPYRRAPQQEEADQRDQHAARRLELRRAAADRECLADDGEAGEHEQDREPDMGEGEDRAVGDAGSEAPLLAEMVGEQHRLAVAWHESMEDAEQNRGSHGSGNRRRAAVSDIAEPARHAAIEPVLEGNDLLHGGGVTRGSALGKPRETAPAEAIRLALGQ